jgi:hypothetical protein
MSTSESTLLNPSAESQRDSFETDGVKSRDVNPTPKLKQRRDPLYLLIIYGLSTILSVAAISCVIWGYTVVSSNPFDEWANKSEHESYEESFFGMQSIVFLVNCYNSMC